MVGSRRKSPSLAKLLKKLKAAERKRDRLWKQCCDDVERSFEDLIKAVTKTTAKNEATARVIDRARIAASGGGVIIGYKERLKYAAFEKLSAIGRPALSVLIDDLQKHRHEYDAICIIAAMGSAADDAVPELIALLKRDFRSRGSVVQALGDIGTDRAATALRAMLKKPLIDVVEALGRCRSDVARRALEKLQRQTLQGNSSWVNAMKTSIARSLSQIKRGA